jgi:hypothetical protein
LFSHVLLVDPELGMVIALLGFSRVVLEEATSLLLEVYRAIENEFSSSKIQWCLCPASCKPMSIPID